MLAFEMHVFLQWIQWFPSVKQGVFQQTNTPLVPLPTEGIILQCKISLALHSEDHL